MENQKTNEELMTGFISDPHNGSFDHLVSRFLGPAVAVARAMLTDTALAEDAVQETFLRIVRKRDQYNTSMVFDNWFYTVLRNICRDILRKMSRQDQLLLKAAENSTLSAEDPAPIIEEGYELMDGLDSDSRTILTLRVIEGMNFARISTVLGISREAAKKRAQRALKKMRELNINKLSPLKREDRSDYDGMQ